MGVVYKTTRISAVYCFAAARCANCKLREIPKCTLSFSGVCQACRLSFFLAHGGWDCPLKKVKDETNGKSSENLVTETLIPLTRHLNDFLEARACRSAQGCWSYVEMPAQCM